MSKKKRKKLTASYVVGSVALCAGACAVIPKLLPKISTFMYNQMYKPSDPELNEENWWTDKEPIVSKRQTDETSDSSKEE